MPPSVNLARGTIGQGRWGDRADEWRNTVRRFPAAAGAYRGNRVAGLDDVAGVPQQALVVSVKAQVTVAVIEDHQQAGTAQPVGEHHPAAMHGTDLGAGIGADQYAVPLGSSIAAAWSAVAGDETSVHRPGQFTFGLGERPAKLPPALDTSGPLGAELPLGLACCCCC